MKNMDVYRDTLEHIIGIIVKSYAVILSVNVIALVVCILLKKRFKLKKIITLLTVVVICICLSASLVLVPRVIDLNKNAYIIVEDGKLLIDETNVLKNSGSIMFYGYADVFYPDGNSVKIFGVNFFELSQNPYEEYHGDIVYTKYSRQLIAIE